MNFGIFGVINALITVLSAFQFPEGSLDKIEDRENVKKLFFNCWEFLSYLCVNNASRCLLIVSRLINKDRKCRKLF